MKKIIDEMALDIMRVSSLPLEISGAIATDLAEIGYLKQVQGKWLEVRTVRYNGTKPYTQIAHQCSNCKWLNKHSKGWNTNYCPNCSAKMKGAE